MDRGWTSGVIRVPNSLALRLCSVTGCTLFPLPAYIPIITYSPFYFKWILIPRDWQNFEGTETFLDVIC